MDEGEYRNWEGKGREKSVALEEAQARSRAQKKKMVRKRKIGGKELPQEKAKPCNILGQLARIPSPSVWTSGSARAEWAQCLSPLLQVSLKK